MDNVFAFLRRPVFVVGGYGVTVLAVILVAIVVFAAYRMRAAK